MSNELTTVAERVTELAERYPEHFAPPEAKRKAPTPKPDPVKVDAVVAKHESEAVQMGAALEAERQALFRDVAALQREVDACRVLETVDPQSGRARMGELAAFAAQLERRDLTWKSYYQQFDERCVAASAWAIWRGNEVKQESELEPFVQWAAARMPPTEVERIARQPSVARALYSAWQADTATHGPSRGVKPVPKGKPPVAVPKRRNTDSKIERVRAALEAMHRG
jgi:hypothetical protein